MLLAPSAHLVCPPPSSCAQDARHLPRLRCRVQRHAGAGAGAARLQPPRAAEGHAVCVSFTGQQPQQVRRPPALLVEHTLRRLTDPRAHQGSPHAQHTRCLHAARALTQGRRGAGDGPAHTCTATQRALGCRPEREHTGCTHTHTHAWAQPAPWQAPTHGHQQHEVASGQQRRTNSTQLRAAQQPWACCGSSVDATGARFASAFSPALTLSRQCMQHGWTAHTPAMVCIPTRVLVATNASRAAQMAQ
jgi:hypothetical protein